MSMSGLAMSALLTMTTAASKASDVAMLDCSGLPCISVQSAGGGPLTMLIDTGNSTSLLDLAKVKTFGPAIDLEPVKDSTGKPVPGYFRAMLKDVRIGQAAIGDLEFLAIDMGKAIDQGHFPRSNGTIAYTAFQGRLLTLDFRHHLVGVDDASSAAPCGTSCGTITYPTFGLGGPPIVVTTGFRVNGKNVNVQVDTLYAGTMLIYPTSVDKLGLNAEAGSVRTEHFPFTDGGVEMVRGGAADESFDDHLLIGDAPIYFATPKVHTPDGMFDGTVGAALFARHVVHLDFSTNRFWME